MDKNGSWADSRNGEVGQPIPDGQVAVIVSDEVEAQPFTSVRCPFPSCAVVGQSVAGVRRHITKIHHVDGRSVDLSEEVVHAATVFGPHGEKARLLFYSDGSIRLRIHDAGPMVISEAFLPGEGKHVIVKLDKG